MKIFFFQMSSGAKARRGFTLVEVIIAMGILIAVGVTFAQLSLRITGSTLQFTSSLVTQQAIQETLLAMIPEIRSIAQSNDGAYPISAASTSTFEFYSDIDRDGLFERVRYFWNGTKFTKGVIKPTGSPLTYVTSTEVLVDQVQNLVTGTQLFTYYDKTATSSASTPMSSPIDPLGIKIVKIYIVANQGTTAAPSLVGVETEATIRNLRYK
jgi:prepilin-type N-terminal cleavage/methylation domain-containing protein